MPHAPPPRAAEVVARFARMRGESARIVELPSRVAHGDEEHRRVLAALVRERALVQDLAVVQACPACGKRAGPDLPGSRVTRRVSQIKYAVEGEPARFLSVPVSDPETIFADVAIALGSRHPRAEELASARISVPLAGRAVPVWTGEDAVVGGPHGIARVTPAFDAGHLRLARARGMEPIVSFGPDGSMCEGAMPEPYRGLGRLALRKAVHADLAKAGWIDGEEEVEQVVPVCADCGVPFEAKPENEWRARVGEFGRRLADAIRAGRIQVSPRHEAPNFARELERLAPWSLPDGERSAVARDHPLDWLLVGPGSAREAARFLVLGQWLQAGDPAKRIVLASSPLRDARGLGRELERILAKTASLVRFVDRRGGRPRPIETALPGTRLEDRWILGRASSASTALRVAYDTANLPRAVRILSGFLLRDVSRVYLPLSRARRVRAATAVPAEDLVLPEALADLALRLVDPLTPGALARSWPIAIEGAHPPSSENAIRAIREILAAVRRIRLRQGRSFGIRRIVLEIADSDLADELAHEGELVAGALGVEEVRIRAPEPGPISNALELAGEILVRVGDASCPPDLAIEAGAFEPARRALERRLRRGHLRLTRPEFIDRAAPLAVERARRLFWNRSRLLAILASPNSG